MTDVFISYARADYAKARVIADAICDAGYEVWIDDDLPAHGAFSTLIEEQLKAARAVLVLWSEQARASRWVPAEAGMAFEADKLVQLSLDGVLPPLPFNRIQCETAASWNGEPDAPTWHKLVASIAELTGTGSPAQPVLPGSLPGREPLVAILPFDNLSSDSELAYFCDGISEEIQRTVSDGSTLKVVARSSAFQFRGADKEISKVAAALGTTHVLDGSVRRSGDRVRISAELVDCASRNAIWGDRFDGTLDDVFDLQEKIAGQVAAALRIALAPSSSSSASSLPSDLYDTFLRARRHLADGDATFDDSAQQAIPKLEKVTREAPDFAPAWEMLAVARASFLRSGHFEGDYDPARDAVIEAAHAALALDPKRGGAHLALAMLEPWGAYVAREKRLLKALEVSPNDPAILTDMSNFCWSVGRFHDALGFAKRACELNPIMPSAQLHLAQMLIYTCDYEGGVKMARKLRERWPTNPGIMLWVINTSGFLGFWDVYDEQVGAIDQFDGWPARDMKAARAFNEALRHKDPQLVRTRTDRYAQLIETTGTLPLNLVLSIAAFGLVDEALDLAEKASYDYIFDPKGDRPSVYYPGTILGKWSEVIQQPRFIELCERLGLNEYWLASGAWPDCVEWVGYDFKEEVRKTHLRRDEPHLTGHDAAAT